MNVRILILGTALTVGATPVIGQGIIAEIDWQDPELVEGRANNLALLGPGSGGLESVGASELTEAKIPVLGLLPSDLDEVFSTPQLHLEAVGPSGSEEPDVTENVESDTLISDDRYRYHQLHSMLDENLQLRCSGTRLVSTASAVGLSTPSEVEDEGPYTEVYERYAEEERYGALYYCLLSCATFEVRSFCSDNTYVDAALESHILVFPGVVD